MIKDFKTDPFLLNFQNFATDMDVGDYRHYDIDDRLSLFVICQGDDLYTGWFYWVKGNIPAETFTNATLESITAIGYERGLLQDVTIGSMYNDVVVTEMEASMDSTAEVAVESPTGPVDPTNSPNYGIGINTIDNPSSVYIDEGEESIMITIKKSGDEMDNKTETQVEEVVFNLDGGNKCPTAWDYDKENSVLNNTSEALARYEASEKQYVEKQTKLETKEAAPVENNKLADMSVEQIVQQVILEAKFLDKDDTLFND